MRFLFVVLAALVVAQCAGGDRFRVGDSDRALVIIGVAEAADATESHYSMLWRTFDPAHGIFLEHDGEGAFEAETNSPDTVRVSGIPGEFTVVEVRPGSYALDSVFGQLRDGGLNYFAQGIVTGPSRPSFDVRAGEAVYLGIWQVSLDHGTAVARQWRSEASDLSAATRAAHNPRGQVVMREVIMRDVACTPRRMSSRSQREYCR